MQPVLYTKIKPELELIVQSGLWLGSVGTQCATFGQKLLMLSYDKESLTLSRLSLHFALTVVPLYLKSNAENRFINKEWLQKAVNVGEHIAIALSIINFFRFLKTGKKPSLVDFFLGLDIITLRSNQRNVGYKYMTRELIWGGFMELIGLVLPLINVHKVQRIFKNALKGEVLSGTHFVTPRLTAMTMCAYCGDRPTLPHHMGCCGEVFCYYCIQGNLESDSQFCCVKCGVKVQKVFELC